MQRAGNTYTTATASDWDVEAQIVMEHPNSPPRRRMGPILPPATTDPPPLTSATPRRPFGLRSPHSHRWVHAVPFLIIVCFVILWWFCYQVNLVIKDGRITQNHPTVMPLFLNGTILDLDLGRLTILAVATSPNPAVGLALSMINKTGDAYPVSGNN